MSEAIYRFIEENPGVTAYRIAQAFNVTRAKIDDELVWLTTICEDDKGHLYTMVYAWSVF